jgi:hypothetical protein
MNMSSLPRLAPWFLLAACGATSPGTAEPPYGTITGTLTARHAPTAPLRVALEWLSVTPGQGALEVAQDTQVVAGDPATYTIEVTTLPPAAAISKFFPDQRQDVLNEGVDPDMQWAQGALLVYEDGDGDGKLTLMDQDGTSPDHVVGQAAAFTAWFLMDGTPAPQQFIGGFPVAPALSATHAPLVDPQPGECGYDTPQGHMRTPCGQHFDQAYQLALPATVDLDVSFDPHLDHYTCDRFWGSQDWPDFASNWNQWSPHAQELCSPGVLCNCTGYNCPLDVPPQGAAVTCSADRTAYTYKTCVEDETICGTRFCHFGHGERDPNSPPPANWPCP